MNKTICAIIAALAIGTATGCNKATIAGKVSEGIISKSYVEFPWKGTCCEEIQLSKADGTKIIYHGFNPFTDSLSPISEVCTYEANAEKCISVDDMKESERSKHENDYKRFNAYLSQKW
jgi:hypothetical protein